MVEIVNNFDLNILLWVQDNLRTDFITFLMKYITSIGSVVLAVFVGWLIVRGNAKERFVGITALVSIGIEVLLVNGILKNLLARPRPFVISEAVIPLVDVLSEFSFPSGHTALAFAIAFVIYRNFSNAYGLSAILLATLVGVSRVYLGVHYPSDVLAGIAVAYVASLFAEYVVKKVVGMKFLGK